MLSGRTTMQTRREPGLRYASAGLQSLQAPARGTAQSGRMIMQTRRRFLTTTLGAGAALAAGAQPALTQPAKKREIVDAQVHMWKANSPDWPWDPGVKPQLPEPFTYERALALMDEAGVDRVVIVPPGLN